MPKVQNRLWADVYNSAGVLLGTIRDVISADATKFLDGVGSWSMTVTGTVEDDFDLLVNDNRVKIFVEEPSGERELGGGSIRQVKIAEGPSGGQMVVSGPDFLDDLTRKSVLLGLSFDNATLYTVVSYLTNLVPGWTSTTDEILGNTTARFDGASVLKALTRVCEENGIHFRLGADQVLEFGEFGNANSLILRNPPGSVTEEMNFEDGIILVDQITQDTSSEQVVDWIIPLGAGTGSAGLTLKLSTRTSPYPIQTMVGPDGATIYYLSVAPSYAAASQRVVTFKDIGPIANSDTAKIEASNALYDAAAAWLQKNSVPLTSYSVTGLKNHNVIKPGDTIRLNYKGKVRTPNKKWLTRINVDEDFWIMKVQESVNASGSKLNLTINSIDRYKQDTTRIIVGALESIQAQKVGVQTFPFVFQDSAIDVIQGGFTASSTHKTADFTFNVSEIFTDVISAKLRIVTNPLYVLADTEQDNAYGSTIHLSGYWFAVLVSSNYPAGLTLTIDGVDVTTALGGPWNPGTGNSPVDVTLDITQYIINAPGGLYQSHSIVVEAGAKSGDAKVVSVPGHNPAPGFDVSHGFVEAKFIVLGTARAVIPAP